MFHDIAFALSLPFLVPMRASLAVSLCLASASLAALHSLPDDTYAFPKYRVSFLNGHPVLNETAERWLKDGLRGGDLEFLDQPWEDSTYTSPPKRKEIGPGDDAPSAQQPLPHSDTTGNALAETAEHNLEHMKMGPRDSYICLIPKPLENTNTTQEEEVEDLSPARSWSLLQSLSGTCLYHRQGWFTYSYCHNDEIRQFKEVIPAQPRFPGPYKPDEDPEWDSYTLGRAPRNPEPGADLTVAEQNAQAANLELARTAGSRYLVQRWGDGTICDKTNSPREVEVQFHCSMEMTDHILFVKETKTCSYVLVIHTPRLCSEPGFQSKREGGEGAEILCREVVDVLPGEGPRLPKADHPLKVPLRKTVLPAPAPKSDKGKNSDNDDKHANKEKLFSDLLRQTLEALAASGADATHKGNGVEGEFVIELNDDATADDIDDDRIVAALRAAGYNVQAEVVKVNPRESKGKNDKGKADNKGNSDKKQAKKPKKWL